MGMVRERWAFWTVFGIVFLDLLGFGLIIPILPLYAESFGATPAMIGILIATYSAMIVVSSPVLGRISDLYGRRPVLLISIGGYVVAWILFGMAGSLLMLFLSRVVAGITGGNVAPAQAYIADITPKEEMANRLGLLGAAYGLGFIFGPGLGGLLSSQPVIEFLRFYAPVWIPIHPFSVPAFVAAILSGISLVMTYMFLPESRDGSGGDREYQSQLRQVRQSLADRNLGTLVIVFFVMSLAFSAIQGMFVLFTSDTFGYGTVMNGYLLSFIGVIAVIMQGGVVGRLSRFVTEERLAKTGAVLEGLALLSLPFTLSIGATGPVLELAGILGIGGDLLALLLALGLFGIGQALTSVSLNTLVSFSAREDEQGGAFGLTQSASALARAVGPGIAGMLYAIHTASPFVAGGILFLLIVPLLYRFDRDAE